MQDILIQVAIYLAAAVAAVPLARALGFGSVLGYLVAGLVIGPVLGLVGSETEGLQHFAEYGVVLMLFLIGLEMRPKTLWDMRRRLIGLGGLQVALTLAAVAAVAFAFGQPWPQATALGIILCLSSTAIVMQSLSERRLVHGEGGRAAFAVLLFQDLAVVPLLALLPLLGAAAGGAPEASSTLVDAGAQMPGPVKAVFVVAVGLAVVLGGRFLTRPLYRFIAMARLPEIQTAAALLLVVSISAALGWLHLSPALGSFLAGVVLANSEYRHELESHIAPFKGLLLGLFFITVGSGLDLGLLVSDWPRLLAITALLMAIKATILYALGGPFGLRGSARLLLALAPAQAGEFAFFLLAFAVETGALTRGVAADALLVASLSMFLTPALFGLYAALGARLDRGAARPQDAVDETGPVIIAGMGRFGQVVNRMLTGLGHKTVVLDGDPQTIDRLRAFGIKGFYGEVDRPELLAAAGIAEARAIVLAIDDPEKVVKMAAYVSRRYPHVRIVARARDRHHVYQLYAAGAPQSVRELFDGAVRAGGYALAALDYDEEEIARVAAAFVAHDRHMLAELAELWDPDVPPERNPAYVAKARAQTEAIEAALRGPVRAGAPREEEGPAAPHAAE